MRIFGYIFGFILITIASIQIAMAVRVKQSTLSALKADCPSCTSHIESVRVRLFPPKITFYGLRYVTGSPDTTQVDLRAGSVIVRLSTDALLKKEIVVPEINVIEPNVVVTEGDLKTPKRKKTEDAAGPSPLSKIGRLVLLDGKFTYDRVHDGKTARIRVNDIQGKIEPSGSDLEANLHGQLENSGHFTLVVTTPKDLEKVQADINLKISNQKLVDFNPYFIPSEGIEISGQVHSGESVVRVRGRKINGSVTAVFSELNLSFRKTKDRSAITAFITNLVKTFKLKSKNTDEKPHQQTQKIEETRHKDETLLHFIFRAMGNGALELAS